MRVLGLDVGATIALPGLPAARADQAITVVPGNVDWDAQGADVVSDLRFPDGAPALRIEAGLDGTWRFWGHGYGAALVAADGRRVHVPVAAAPGRIARLLHGQVLPFLASRSGFEVLHACAVVVDGRAVLLCAPSGSGKSTVLRALLARGAGFLADDSVAVDDDLRAWAGPGVIGPELEPAPVAAEALPIGAVVLLRRGAEAGLAPLVAPWELLAQGYDALPRDPARATAGLDRLSRLAGSAPLLELGVAEGGVEDAAARLLDAVGGAMTGGR